MKLTPSYSAGFSPAWSHRFYLNLLQKIVESAEQGGLVIALPNGQQLCSKRNIPTVATLHIHNYRLLRRILFNGMIGWGEGYVAGDWSSPDLKKLLLWAVNNESSLKNAIPFSQPGRWIHRLAHHLNRNSKRGSKRNIAFHYDLGNEFYQQWLDPSMTYSSAYFQTDKETLEEAQQRKYATALALSGASDDQHVLEIGCGWGGFAEHLLENSLLHLTGVTLSKEQLKFANQRLLKIKGTQRARLSLTDYRDLNDQYDAVVSIEMFEAVGQAQWPTYFSQLYKLLKPGGKAVLQVITIDESRFDYYQENTDFIQRYIFPGGMLPTVTALKEQTASAGLSWVSEDMFGKDYATTLHHWREAFLQRWTEIEPLGFDQRFKRLWLYYFAYCEAGFLSGRLNVGLFVIEKPEIKSNGSTDALSVDSQ